MFGELLIIGAISLTGVSGENLRVRVFFDANNVKVGDPLVLNMDFLGEGEFKSIHPPKLARQVDSKDWKVDDFSAKTSTYDDGRRLTYRVRPLRKGLLWFPELEFELDGDDGIKRIIRSNTIPVHAKEGEQVAIDEMDSEVDNGFPKPPEIQRDYGNAIAAGSDEEFAWRKAVSKPSADGFSKFEFPIARMNEATCAIREGNWSRAMSIYRKLEWTIGQTEEIERGMIAALALKYDNPAVELPVWRSVMRPLLKYDWLGRVGIVLGVLSLFSLILWIVGRGIRAVACLAVMFAIGSADAQGIFQQFFNNAPGMFGGRQEAIKINAEISMDVERPKVGETFNFMVKFNASKNVSITQVAFEPSITRGLALITASAKRMEDGRIAIPARFDIPYSGLFSMSIRGMASSKQEQNDGGSFFSFSFSNSFATKTKPIDIKVKPLPNQPKDFSGIVANGLRMHELCDILNVETNDVVTITYRMYTNGGYVPSGFVPPGAAFEWVRNEKSGVIEYKRFFVADGAKETPKMTICYYDPLRKQFAQASCGQTRLNYDIINNKNLGGRNGKTD